MNSKWELNSKPNVWLSMTTSYLAKSLNSSRDHLKNVSPELFLRAAVSSTPFLSMEEITAKKKQSNFLPDTSRLFLVVDYLLPWELSKEFPRNRLYLGRV
jgi:hypothetical protein